MPPSNFSLFFFLMDNISINIVCKEIKRSQLTKVNQLFQRVYSICVYLDTFDAYPGGDSHIKVTGVIAVPVLGVKIRGLVPLRVGFVRGMAVPFRVLSRQILEEELNVSQKSLRVEVFYAIKLSFESVS